MPSPATEGERGWEGTLSGERVERRLTALLAADVAGYSRLMGADAEATLAAPKAIRRELVDPWIVEHRGPPCRDDHGGRNADAAGRCRERWILKKAEPGRGGGDGNRRHLVLRRAWNDEHASATGPSSVRKRKCIEQGGRSGCGSVPSMVHNDGLPPLMTKCPLAEIRRATGLSTRYVIMIRKGLGIQPQETISILVAKRSKASIGLN
jgi:hypothetical protein